jgi:uncharacterized spore protein YtfJ
VTANRARAFETIVVVFVTYLSSTESIEASLFHPPRRTPAGGTDVSVNQIESIVERLQHSATVRSVFGDPIERGDRTVVPVARVAFGFGGGYGSGGEETSETSGQGGGGGGGASATPVGALEITDEGTRFVRFDERRRSLGLLVVGLVAGMLLGKRSSKMEN